jgi:tetratricopeptide (TPR) repeat protein
MRLIEGGIQRHNNNLSIRIQFIRADHEDHLWGEEYDGEWKDIFYIQDEIAKQVARQLQTVLSPEEIGQIEKEPTENLEAYRLYLKARYYWRQRTETTILKGIQYCKQAIEIDSMYALAWSGLADCYCLLMWYAPPSYEVHQKAEQAALKALELDNTLAEAHASLGFVKLIEWDWKAAEDKFIKAIALNPNYFNIHILYGLILTYTDQVEKAIEEMIESCKLDPLSSASINNLGMTYITARRYDDAIEVTEEALDVFSIEELHSYLGQAYLYKGLYDKALAVFKKQENDIWTGITYSLMGETNKANQVLTEILKKSESEYISPFLLSLLYFSLSQEDQGFRLMEKAYDDHDLELTEIKTYPLLDIIRSDPRYLEILRKMGLE